MFKQALNGRFQFVFRLSSESIKIAQSPDVKTHLIRTPCSSCRRLWHLAAVLELASEWLLPVSGSLSAVVDLCCPSSLKTKTETQPRPRPAWLLVRSQVLGNLNVLREKGSSEDYHRLISSSPIWGPVRWLEPVLQKENQLLQIVLWPPYTCHSLCMCAHVHTWINVAFKFYSYVLFCSP